MPVKKCQQVIVNVLLYSSMTALKYFYNIYFSEPKSIASLKERCHKALYHIVCGLSCLQYFENSDPQNACDDRSVVVSRD